ncbi:zinc finger protein 354C [Drosophila gunungcola]|uniref:Uncharacterized protein n=1 Tax=Drosophila gunungcola TaxID=103775 RepID=A0A9P9YEJ2_9MUSC|nr:zinc finger protein 354C [Drosophila gunungcola]KAI8035078.1 hypothetical protein M5D96_012171 [Drosophila gunungcola]
MPNNHLESRVVDLGVACLVCLMEEPDASSIYGHDPESPHMLILEKIRHCTSLQLLDGSPAELQRWPDKICKQCYLELSVSYRFHEKCAAVQKLFYSGSSFAHSSLLLSQQESEQLKLDLKQAQLRLPATLKIKRLDMEPSFSSAIARGTEPTYYQDVEAEEEEADALTLLPDGAMVLSLNDLQDQDPIKQQPEDEDSNEQQQQHEEGVEEEQEEEEEGEEQLGLDPWDADHTPEHLYEIETPLMEESVVDSPPLPPPQSSSQLRKRTYRRVSPVVKRERLPPVPERDEDYKPASTTKRRHSERSPKICDVCGNTYKYQHALNAHMRRHNNERPYPCEVCQKAFISNVELRRHMRVHTGQKPYGCRFCERRFSDFGSSKKHERIHTGERPYICEVCHKGFAYAHVLSVHRRTHTGKKQFQCTQCDKGFTKKSYLSAHMDQHRGGSGSGSGTGSSGGASSSAGGSSRSLRLPARREHVRRETVRKQVPVPEAFTLDSVVLEQTKVLEECIVANDFMFNEEDHVEEEQREAGGNEEDLGHDESYAEPDFGDVDGYQSVRSVKELVGDLLDTEQFVDESKYMID